jgi:GNAT superfamily N-acetyltransferase
MTPIIRRATDADAPAILQVHLTSIQILCGPYHTPAQIEAWIDRMSAENYREAMARGEAIFVAEDNGRIVGFSCLQDFQLRAVYVHPDFIRRKVGSAVLGAAEKFAVDCRHHEITMDASINSESFYLSCGYGVVERSTHRFRNGTEIPCVRMRKVL